MHTYFITPLCTFGKGNIKKINPMQVEFYKPCLSLSPTVVKNDSDGNNYQRYCHLDSVMTT